MGFDVWPVLGRRKEASKRKAIEDPKLLTQLAPNELEFMAVTYAKHLWPQSAQIQRSYALFSLLSDPTKELWPYRLWQCKPLEACAAAKAYAETFIENMDKGTATYLDTKTELLFSDRYNDGQYDNTLYTIDQLLNANYDELAMVDKYWNDDFKPHPEGLTYRDMIDKSREGWDGDYFEFLKKAKADGWEFVLLNYWG